MAIPSSRAIITNDHKISRTPLSCLKGEIFYFKIVQVQIRHDELDSFVRAAKHLQVFDVGEDGEEEDDAFTTMTTTSVLPKPQAESKAR